MKRKRPLQIPQHEFGFTPNTFNLIQDSAQDGERIARERAEIDEARRRAQSAQARLPMQATPFRLRAGDTIAFAGQSCPVVRVTDSSAVVAVAKAPRDFTTLFGVRVNIQPKPSLVRISPNSEVPILNR